MYTLTVSAKGWVVIPKDLREKYGLEKGTQVLLEKEKIEGEELKAIMEEISQDRRNGASAQNSITGG